MLNTRFYGKPQYEPLTNDQIMRVAPSVFAEEAHSSRSERYAYLPTSEVVVALRNEGFLPYHAAQSKSRIAGKSEFTKHMLRFRYHTDVAKKAVVGEEVNEIVLVNSHDGTTSYQMSAGVFKFACANGLLVGNLVSKIVLPHKATTLDNIIEGAFTVLHDFDDITQSRENMKSLELLPSEQLEFAQSVVDLRYERNDFRPAANAMLAIHREADRGRSLWTTFNVLQENLIRGGVPRTVNPPENGRRATTRAITGITESMKLNEALWDLAETTKMIHDGIL